MTNLLALTASDGWALVPVGSTVALGLIVLFLDLVLSGKRREAIPAVSINGIVLVALATWLSRTRSSVGALGGAIDLDRFGVGFSLVFLAGAYLSLLLSHRFVRRFALPEGTYCSLVIFAVSGMMLMAQAADLLVLFVGLEIMSVSFYVLVGLSRPEARSPEAALKYFLVGAFASGVILYGIVLVYGARGSLGLAEIATAVGDESGVLARIGMGLILAGFLFKVAAVPFHMWAPDVYEGAPTPVTVFLSTGVKGAAFAAMLRVLVVAFPQFDAQWKAILWLAAVVTMIVGNVAAVRQTSFKRLLAYSSIAHAGYMLVGVVSIGVTASDRDGGPAVLFYLMAYTVASAGAFGIVSITGEGEESYEEIDDLKGLAWTHPWLAAATTLFLLTLAGIPPTAGFVAKYGVFVAAVNRGFVDLAVIGVLTSVVAAAYYLRIVATMYMTEPDPARPFTCTFSLPAATAIALSALGALYLGIIPSGYWRLAQAALGSIF